MSNQGNIYHEISMKTNQAIDKAMDSLDDVDRAIARKIAKDELFFLDHIATKRDRARIAYLRKILA